MGPSVDEIEKASVVQSICVGVVVKNDGVLVRVMVEPSSTTVDARSEGHRDVVGVLLAEVKEAHVGLTSAGRAVDNDSFDSISDRRVAMVDGSEELDVLSIFEDDGRVEVSRQDCLFPCDVLPNGGRRVGKIGTRTLGSLKPESFWCGGRQTALRTHDRLMSELSKGVAACGTATML